MLSRRDLRGGFQSDAKKKNAKNSVPTTKKDMNIVADLRASKTLLSSTACYERYAETLGRDITPRDIAEVIMTVVACKVYSKDFLMHVRRSIEVDGVLPREDLAVNPCDFRPERHVIVTCVMSHVNYSLGLHTTFRGAYVRGCRYGKCVVWW